jgi:16S rRNA (uracil1498-N3)-methyltransferase
MALPPRFFLATSDGDEPRPGAPPKLCEGEALHALRVLRVQPGDACVGLDGRGRAWPMRVVAAGRRELGLELLGPPTAEPEPGEPGAPLPWIEVAVAFPRRPRAEEMLRRLCQLGAAAIAPLATRQGGPQGVPDAADPRWLRILMDACKQSRRVWLPELGAPRSTLELALARPGTAVALLEPAGGMSLDVWARSLVPGELGTRRRPITLAIGPEGGFDPAERDALLQRGATAVRVAPHVLRIETAAEAALAVVAAIWMR